MCATLIITPLLSTILIRRRLRSATGYELGRKRGSGSITITLNKKAKHEEDEVCVEGVKTMAQVGHRDNLQEKFKGVDFKDFRGDEKFC
ncbi:unnamed protein product [Vicia faba]|uniref:Uncharacterized protein n=1 Tax=Vicia faba TaxID=3906 RepID=A0AAV1AYU8_VICFA|nr:unnamed protein product [Vicia faba]